MVLLNILHQSSLERTPVASGTHSCETENFCDSYQQLQTGAVLLLGKPF